MYEKTEKFSIRDTENQHNILLYSFFSVIVTNSKILSQYHVEQIHVG